MIFLRKVLNRLISKFQLKRGCASFWRSELEKAEVWFWKSFNANENSLALYNLGVVYYERGNFAKAEEHIWKALDLDLRLGKIWLEDCSWRYYWMLEPHANPRVGYSNLYDNILEILGGYDLMESCARKIIQKLEKHELFKEYIKEKIETYFPPNQQNIERSLGKMKKPESEYGTELPPLPGIVSEKKHKFPNPRVLTKINMSKKDK